MELVARSRTSSSPTPPREVRQVPYSVFDNCGRMCARSRLSGSLAPRRVVELFAEPPEGQGRDPVDDATSRRSHSPSTATGPGLPRIGLASATLVVGGTADDPACRMASTSCHGLDESPTTCACPGGDLRRRLDHPVRLGGRGARSRTQRLRAVWLDLEPRPRQGGACSPRASRGVISINSNSFRPTEAPFGRYKIPGLARVGRRHRL